MRERTAQRSLSPRQGVRTQSHQSDLPAHHSQSPTRASDVGHDFGRISVFPPTTPELDALPVSEPGEASEVAADQAADRVLMGQPAGIQAGSVAPHIARTPEDAEHSTLWSTIASIAGLNSMPMAGAAPSSGTATQILDPWPLDLGPAPPLNPNQVRPDLPVTSLQGPAAPGQYGAIAPWEDHPNALRVPDPTKPRRQWQRLSEDEHVMPRQSLEALELDPSTGQTRFSQADYEGSPTLRTPYEMALTKTHANRGGPTADNARSKALMDQATSGSGDVQYFRDVLEPSLQQQTRARDIALAQGVPGADQITDARIHQTVLEQDAFNWERWAGRHDRDFLIDPQQNPGQTVSGELAARGESIASFEDFDWDRTFNLGEGGAAPAAAATAADAPAAEVAMAPGGGPNYGHAALLGGAAAGGMSLLHSLWDGDLSSAELEQAGLATGTGAVAGLANEALTARLGGGMAGGLKAGALIDAVTSGVFSTWDNADAFREGRVSASDATANVAVDTALGVGAGLAGALAGGAAGAQIGAALGTVFPGVGNLIGGAAGFLVGAGTSYLSNWLLTESGIAGGLKDAGGWLLDAAGLEDTLGTVWGGISEGTEWLSDAAGDTWEGITDIGSGVADVAGDAVDWLTDW